MSLYPLGRRVYVKSLDAVGEVSEANYGHNRRAEYVVRIGGRAGGFLTGSDDLRGADWGCDACGRYWPGAPYQTMADGEYPNGLAVCFLCAMQSDRHHYRQA